MRMTTGKLIVLRLVNVSLGRSALFNKLLRWLLVEVLVRRRGSGGRYVASSRFFDVGELAP